MNAGPNRGSAFHVVGAIFDAVYPSGNPDEVLHATKGAVGTIKVGNTQMAAGH